MMMYSKWLELPLTTRHLIAQKLNIEKKNPTHVMDNKVISDGYVIQDVETAMSLANLLTYLSTTKRVVPPNAEYQTVWELFVKELLNPAVATGYFSGIEVMPEVGQVKVNKKHAKKKK